MRKMIDPADGGLMFCHATKRGTFMPQTGKHKSVYEAWAGCSLCSKKPCTCNNGKLLSVEELTSALAYMSQQKKKRGTEAVS